MTAVPVTDPLSSDVVASGTLQILKLAKSILQKRMYQTRYIAAKDTGEVVERMVNGRRVKLYPIWESVSPQDPEAMLSLRGAVIAAAGTGSKAWPVLAQMERDEGLRCVDPPTKAQALHCLEICIKAEEARLQDDPGNLRGLRVLAGSL